LYMTLDVDIYHNLSRAPTIYVHVEKTILALLFPYSDCGPVDVTTV